jgi:hypothetical protein
VGLAIHDQKAIGCASLHLGNTSEQGEGRNGGE